METAQKVKPILVAEDESVMRESLWDWLSGAGYHVETAGEKEKAQRAELSSWDKEGRIIVRQIITRFPSLFPYF